MPHHIPLPDKEHWDIGAQSAGLGKWIKPYTDVGFNHYMCDPWKWSVIAPSIHCPYMEHYYTALDEIPMADQFKYKYLPDVDGNSYSGRFRAFLQSASLPIKATLWTEWHDARLVPWQHFVPMDNTFIDWWGIMDYFLGYRPPSSAAKAQDHGKRPGRDDGARVIATQGKAWAARVLRDEDMLIYVYRLLLEYARVCSPQREEMAFVDDIM